MVSSRYLKPVSAAALILFSVAVMVSASRLGVYSAIGPGPGLFPLALAGILLGLTALWLLVPEPGSEPEDGEAPIGRAGVIRLMTVLGSIAFAIVAADMLGYALMAFLMIAANLAVLGRHKPWLILCLAAAASLGSHYLFRAVLGVALPSSDIPFLRAWGL